jgi:hypothetical protein
LQVSKNQVLKTRVAISFDHQQRSSINFFNVAVHRFQLITVVEGKSCCATANKEYVTVCMYTLLLFWLGKLAASPATEPASASAGCLLGILFNCLLQSVSNILATMIYSGLEQIQFVL